MSDDRDKLLAEIAARPDDDTLRLAFADWLDEHGDAADADRAEFVRVQCELERYRRTKMEWEEKRRSNPHMLRYGGNCDCSRLLKRQRPCPFCKAEDRELKLLAAHPEWSRCRCEACGGKGKLVQRGVGGQSSAALNPVCPTCSGTGDLFLTPGISGASLTPPPKSRAVTFARGFVDGVTCTLAELGSTTTQHQTRSSDSSFYDEVCVHCEATDARGSNALRGPCVPRFVPTAWAIAVVRETPAVRFVLADTTPFYRNASNNGPFGSGLVWDWSSAHVLNFLMEEMAVHHPGNVVGRGTESLWWMEFQTEAEARDALALAAGRVARRHAYPERK